MSVFLENLATEWEYPLVLTEDEMRDSDVDTQLFLESALHLARLTQTKE